MVAVGLVAALAPGVVPASASGATAVAVPGPDATVASDPGSAPPTAGGPVGVDHQAAAATARRTNAPVELPDMRTEASTTSVLPDGMLHTAASLGPVNYVDGSGNWKPIDNSLIVASGGWTNRAGAYQLTAPSSLASGAVQVAYRGLSVSYRLRGAADVVGTVHDDTVTYVNVLPGVTLVLRATGDGIKESLVLADAKTTRSSQFDLTVPAGSKVTTSSTGITVTASNGTALEIPSPWAKDSGPLNQQADGFGSNAVTTSAAGSGTAWRLTTTVTDSYANAAYRVWPVTVDPTFQAVGSSAMASCRVVGPPYNTTNFCSDPSFVLGYGGYPSLFKTRGLLQPDVTALPPDAVIASSNLKLYLSQLYGPTTGRDIEAHTVTSKWTPGSTTWDLRNTSPATAWTTPWGGGDLGPVVSDTNVGPTTGTFWKWDVTAATQSWVSDPVTTDPTPNFGIEMKAQNETIIQLLEFASTTTTLGSSYRPTLDVTWTPRTGVQGFENLWTRPLSDHSSLSVNINTGNLILQSSDAHLAQVGADLTVGRSYNSRMAFVGNGASSTGWSTNRLGAGWSFSTGSDVWIEPVGNNMVVHGPSGFASVYPPTGTANTWLGGPGQNATLTWDGANSYTLRYNKDGTTYTFLDSQPGGSTGVGVLLNVKDANGNQITVDASGGNYATKSITGDLGGKVAFNTDVSGNLTGLTATSGAASRTYGYGLNPTSHKLITFTDATSGSPVTTYGYDPTSGLLTTVLTPTSAGNTEEAKIDYDATGRVLQVTQYTDTAHTVGYTTAFAYTNPTAAAAGTTIVTDANHVGSTTVHTTYTMGPGLETVKTIDAKLRTHTSTWTTNGDVASYTDGLSAAYTLNYNSNNVPTSSQAPSADVGATINPTTYGYNPTPSGFPFYPTTVTDPQGNVSTYAYDTTTGDVMSVANTTSGTSTSLTRQGIAGQSCTGAFAGEVCTATDANGNTTSYGYTTGLVSTTTYPAAASPGTQLGAVTKTYDANNRLATVTDGKAQTTTYSYDNDDRVTQILTNSASTCDTPHANCVAYTYDAAGNLLTRVDNTGTTTLTFDLLNRPTAKANPTTGESDVASYDAVNSLTSLSGGGKTVYYTYDPKVPDVVSIHLPGVTGCGTANINCILFDYDGNDNISHITYPNGVVTTVTRPTSRPTRVLTAGPFGTSDLEYTYYKPGSTTQDIQMPATRNDGTKTTSYTYNSANRLTGAAAYSNTNTNTYTSYGYGYDANGNLTTATQTGATTATQTSAYNANNQLCWTKNASSANACSAPPTGATSYSYDADGSQLTGNHTATYNAKNQTTGIDTSTYTYADAGQAQRTADNSANTYTNWIGGLFQTSHTGPYGQVTYIRLPSGLLVAAANNGRYFYHPDLVTRNINMITDSIGNTVATYTYDPYGNNTATGTYAATNVMRYQASQQDNIGLYKFGDRYYDPTTQHWTQQDTVAGNFNNPTSTNRYTYAGGNPIDNWDPSGRNLLGDAIGLGLAVTGLGVAIAGAIVASPIIIGVGLGVAAASVLVAGDVLTCNNYDFGLACGTF